VDSWDKIIEHRQRRQLRLDEKEIMKSSYPIKANYLIKNGILTEKMVCCLDNDVLDMFLKKHFRQDSYIKQIIDCDTDSNDIIHADADEEESGNHGNTHIPYGLCQREGIEIGKDWTPRDAWNALEGKGYKASDVYESLRNGYGLSKETKEETTIEGLRNSVKSFIEKYKNANEEKLNLMTEFKKIKYRKEAEEEGMQFAKDELERLGISKEDGIRLKKELKDIEPEFKKIRNKNEKEKTEEDKKLEEKYLDLKYNKIIYWDDVYGDETVQSLEEARKEYETLKNKIDEIDNKRKKLREEQRNRTKEIDVRNYKFYSELERKNIKEKVKNSIIFNSINEEFKEKISKTIDEASDIQLSILNKTSDKIHIKQSNDGSQSNYVNGSGTITLNSETYNSRVFWHEYGHYLDDSGTSGMEYDEQSDDNSYGVSSKNFSSSLKTNEIAKDAIEDLKDLFGDKYEFRYDDINNTVNVIKDDSSVHFDFVIDEIIDKELHREKEELDKEYDMPKRPEYEDYFESYRTPKTQKLKYKPKSKTAEQDYKNAQDNYFNKYSNIIKNTDYLNKLSEINKKRAANEKRVCGITDCISAITEGRFQSVYGSHSRSYYEQGSMNVFYEITANIGQMNFENDDFAKGLFKKLMPRMSEKIFDAYDDWMCRNV